MFFFFFFNDTATTEIYPLSLHDALPILTEVRRDPLAIGLGALACGAGLGGATRTCRPRPLPRAVRRGAGRPRPHDRDRKSTRLNSSHVRISYAVFCLKKKKNTT